MHEINFNEQFIVFAIYNRNANWYISDKEIWFLDYQKRIEAYKNRGYDIPSEYIDERRKDLLYIDESCLQLFIDRIKKDRCPVSELKEMLKQSDPEYESDYSPSLYVDFDKHIVYSMYSEDASYEDYVPVDWDGQYKDFLTLIPSQERYWV